MAANLIWTTSQSRTNGIRHTSHHARYDDDICPCIIEDAAGITLIINGYQFEYNSVEEAKVDSENRIENNQGVYLQRRN